LYGRFARFLVKKSGLLAKSADQKWAEKLRGIFSKRHFFGVFCPFLGDLRQFACEKVVFWPFAHFYFLLVAIKSFNIYINKGK
jgi:hypothetical protein